MFHMVNEHGNAHRFTESEAVRDELLQLGYTEVAETPAEVAETPAEVEAAKEEKKPRTNSGKSKKTEKKED